MFSTPDANPGLPLHSLGTNGNLIMNGELRRVTNGVAVFETDAVVFPDTVDLSQARASDLLFGGKLRLLFPTNDVDTNGVLDVLQFDKDNDAYVTGGGITEYSTNGLGFYTTIPEQSAWITGSGGNPHGLLGYQWDLIGPPEPSPFLSVVGNLQPLYMNGTVTNRGTTLVFGLRSTDSFGRTNSFGAFSYKGNAPARVRGDELRIGRFNLKRNDGVKIRVNKTTLRRVNGAYVGKITFNDWNPATPWADYTEWAIEIGEFVRR